MTIYWLYPLVLFLCGCATVVDQRRLKAPDPHVVEFLVPFTYDTSKETDLPRPEPGAFRGVLPGVYTAVYEDDQGIYYRAPGLCVIYMTYPSKGTKFLIEGGIWIEKASPTPKFRLYRIEGYAAGPGPSPIGDLGPCVATSPAGRVSPSVGTYDATAQMAITNPVVVSTVPTSPLATGVGAGLGYAIVAAMIEADRGKIVFLPPPVGEPRIAGTFRRQEITPGR